MAHNDAISTVVTPNTPLRHFPRKIMHTGCEFHYLTQCDSPGAEVIFRNTPIRGHHARPAAGRQRIPVPIELIIINLYYSEW
jgi:hypothetical protein